MGTGFAAAGAAAGCTTGAAAPGPAAGGLAAGAAGAAATWRMERCLVDGIKVGVGEGEGAGSTRMAEMRVWARVVAVVVSSRRRKWVGERRMVDFLRGRLVHRGFAVPAVEEKLLITCVAVLVVCDVSGGRP